MPKAQETVLEIDLKALQHNFQYLKSKLQPNTKFLAVVKAYGYGSSVNEIAKCLEKLKIDYFAVAYVNEGVALRRAGIKTPILVLHPQAINFKGLINNCLEPSLYNKGILEKFITFATSKKIKNYPVHIKFNTGLNRLGFSQEDLNLICNELKRTKTIAIKSLFSHMAASEDFDEKMFTTNQIEGFRIIAESYEKAMGCKPMLHMCNTSGILNYPEAHFDMVRSGIGLYGFGNSDIENKNLKPIASLKTIISQINFIEEGESVGYNRAYKSNSFQKTATLPIGHADGIARCYGNGNGHVFINGKKASIIGNVCMDMIMVNISNINCKEGDEVIIFDAKTTAENLAETVNTISYEILTSVSNRVKRIFIK